MSLLQVPTCMEITCKNYRNIYNDIENVVKNASFVAVDIEFLGLDPEDAPLRCSLFDSVQRRFEKQSASVKRFPPVQWGLAFFTADETGAKYTVNVYNVYLFKHGVERHEFCFSASSLAFLETHGFDFNKLVCDGVSHLNLDELQEVLGGFGHHAKLSRTFGEDLQTLIVQVQSTLLHKLARMRRRSTGSEGALHRHWDKFHLVLPGNELTQLQRSVVLYKLYSEVTGVRLRIAGNLLQVSPEQLNKQDLCAIKDDLLKTIVKELVGASDLMMAIIESRIPIIGHNCLYDLLYMYHYFVAELPIDYEEFKRAVNAVFPTVIDTKVLAEQSKHQLSWHGVLNYRLESLGAFFHSKSSETHAPLPQFVYPDGFTFRGRRAPRSSSGASFHNAAYDALTTGQAFIRLAHLVAYPLQQFAASSPVPHTECLPFRSLLYAVKPYANRIPVPLLGVPYINLVGDDPPPRNPEAILLEVDDEDDIESLKKEMRTQFGRWRCEAKLDGNIVRLATNTVTTYRRVYNYYLDHPTYRVLSGSEYSESLSGSFSSGSSGTPRLRSPSVSSTDSMTIQTVPSIEPPKSPSRSAAYKWTMSMSSLLFTTQLLRAPY